jgi:hypothetical protein
MPPPHLVGAEYVYVLCMGDANSSPFLVYDKRAKVFMVQMGKNVKDISVDRLNPLTYGVT